MTDSISRRDLVALAGVGLVASACTPGGGGNNAADGNSSVTDKSVSDDWGHNPHFSPPTSGNGQLHYPKDFSADYIALLYLGLESNWSIRINTANFKLRGADEDERRDKAIAAFAEMVKNKQRFEKNTKHPPSPRKSGKLDGTDFGYLRFKDPIEIFVLLHQPDLAGKPLNISLDSHRLLSFASRLQAEENQKKKAAERNYCFFNAEPVDLSSSSILKDVALMMRVENWARDEYGDLITDDQVSYSMNIHFTLENADKVKIPMIIDPDTGNGAGNEPPPP